MGEATDLFARSCGLDPVPLSARTARHFIRDFLTEAGRRDWTEAAELAVTEIVTNAVLHAHTAVEVNARLTARSLLVEVRDGNAMLPSPRRYEVQATTGRGLELVAAVSAYHGVRPLGPGGKVVWFCLGAYDARAAGPGGVARPTTASPRDHADDVAVLLEGVPSKLWLAANEHHDAILREYALHRAARSEEHPDLADADEARTLLSTAVDVAIAAAMASDVGGAVHADAAAQPQGPPAGHVASLTAMPAVVDAALSVARHRMACFAVLQDALDEAEGLAVADRFLVRPSLPEIRALRQWACEQVVVQADGERPTRWHSVDERLTEGAMAARPPAMPVWDASIVREAEVGVVAADDANRIIAVSRPLAAALGWDTEDLVGRRIVTLVPPRLREAHVAGFSRHLSSGEAHVLGVPLRLPVLRRDGSEATYPFFIEQVPVPARRSVYVAWINVDTAQDGA